MSNISAKELAITQGLIPFISGIRHDISIACLIREFLPTKQIGTELK